MWKRNSLSTSLSMRERPRVVCDQERTRLQNVMLPPTYYTRIPQSSPPSLVSQGYHWIHTHGPPRGNVARKQCYESESDCHTREGDVGGRLDSVEQLGH